jgi:hypothetical protein
MTFRANDALPRSTLARIIRDVRDDLGGIECKKLAHSGAAVTCTPAAQARPGEHLDDGTGPPQRRRTAVGGPDRDRDRRVSGLFDRSTLARSRTGADGRFTVAYGADTSAASLGPRTLLVEVTDPVDRRLARIELEDVAAAVLPLPDFVVRPADGEGLLVTLGTGMASFVSTGNAIRLLIDNVEAWGHLARLFAGATSSIEFMQMEFDVPDEFEPDPGAERPVAVFGFGSPVPTPTALRQVNAGFNDIRPERVLESRARQGHVDVRIMISQPVLEHRLVLLGGVFAVVGAFVVLLVGGLLEMLARRGTRSSTTSPDPVNSAFGSTAHPPRRSARPTRSSSSSTPRRRSAPAPRSCSRTSATSATPSTTPDAATTTATQSTT